MKQSSMKTVAILGIIALSACSPQIRNHGYVPSQEDISSLIVGVDTRSSITEAIGSPSEVGPVGSGNAYYIRSRMRYFTMSAPKTVSREVVVLRFDQSDVLKGVERYGLEDGRVVALDPNYTKLPGDELTVLQRMLRSIGGMNAATLFN